MTTAYTSLLGLALPVTGELSGTWGDMVDNAITSPLDVAVAGTQTISGSQTAVTLSVTNGNSSATNLAQVGSGATGSAQYAIINCTGNPASLLTITAPASSREYTILNSTSTSQSVKIVGVGPTTGVTIVSGEKAVVTWNGSDYVKVATSTAGSGSVTAVTGSGNIASSGGTAPNITFTGTLPVTNGGTGVTTSTGTGNIVLSTSPVLTTPNLGTPASGNLSNTTVDGTNGVGFRSIPSAGAAKTSSYTLLVADRGEFVEIGSGGSITVPTSTFAAGDAVVIFNNNAGTSTITTSAPTVYVGGTNTTRTSVTLTARGICNVLFITPTLAIITGNVT